MLDKRCDVDPFSCERHYLPTAEEVETIARVVADASGEDEATAPAVVNWTTYFDTADLRYFLSFERRGAVARRLRLREYEGGPRGSVCYLELKQTSKVQRSKVRLSAPLPILVRLIQGDVNLDRTWVTDDSKQGALRAIRNELAYGQVAARVGTWYRRRCLVSRPSLRVTLDEDLTFFRPVALGEPRPHHPEAVAFGPNQVLEVKYAGELPSWLGGALEGLREVPEFSKFRSGMLAVWHPSAPPPREP